MKLGKLGIAGVLVSLTLCSPAKARAGTFEVVACAAAQDGANHSWTGSTNQPNRLAVTARCPPTAVDGGLSASDRLDAPDFATAGGAAAWQFLAPSGTQVVALRYSRYLGKDTDNDWHVFGETSDGQVFDTCQIALADLSCATGQPGYRSGTERMVQGLAASGLRFGFECAPSAGATTCGAGGTLHNVWAYLYSAAVTLSDELTPTLAIAGSISSPDYTRSTRTATFDATDNTGIRAGRIYVDGSPAATQTYDCDFTYTVPCSDKTGAQLTLDTRTVSDGTHSVQVAVADPAGNETRSAAQTVTVDNGAPAAPLNLSVDGGSGWHSANGFSVSWTNPGGQVAPIAAARYQVCAVDGTGCEATQRVAGSSLTRLDGISVPSPGEWALRLWLEDAAGNVDPASAAETSLRYGSPPDTPKTPTTSDVPRQTIETVPIAAPAPADPLAPIPPVAATVRREPSLRLTSARLRGGKLIVVGRLTHGTKRRLVLSIALRGHRPIRRAITTGGTGFKVTLPVPRGTRTLRGTITARLAGDSFFRPASRTLRLR